MDPDHLYRFVAFLLLLGLSAIFAASETALFSLKRTHSERLRHEKSRTAQLVLSQLKDPPRLLITILVANEIVNITAETLAVSLAIEQWGEWGEFLSILILTPVIVILTDITPKTVALTMPESIARSLVWPVDLVARLLFPLRWLFMGISGMFGGLATGHPGTAEKDKRAEEIKALVRVGEREGALDASERELIHKVFAFGNRTVADVMTPRMEIVSLPVDMDPVELVGEVRRHHLSRIPIYRSDKDNIVGILYAKDLIGLRLKRAEFERGAWTIERILRKPFFVPQKMKLELLLTEFRREKVHLAMAVDEYGGSAGLVTMQDILEELFGEIHDEFDVKEEHVRDLGGGVFEVPGTTPWKDFKAWAGLSDVGDDNGTVGGWVIEQLGRIPKPGEQIQWESWAMSVVAVHGGKIERLRLQKLDGNVASKT